MSRMALLLVVLNSFAISQTPSYLNYFPVHAGDIRQYHSQFTGELIRTEYIDSVVIDSISKDVFAFCHNENGGQYNYRIDSSGNVYTPDWQPQYVRYKLYADSGDSWQAGFVNITNPVFATVAYIYQAIVSESTYTTVKAIRFQYYNSPNDPPFTIGTDHLAAGLGLIKSEVEPSDVYVLTGAIINGVQYGTITSINYEISPPQTICLSQNYPNPFNPSTRIRFEIPASGFVTLKVFDVLGREIATLMSGQKSPGTYEMNFDGSALTSGIYYYRLQTGSSVLTKRMVLLK